VISGVSKQTHFILTVSACGFVARFISLIMVKIPSTQQYKIINAINRCSDCVLLQHVSVLGNHHQAIVINEANTVIELFLTWIQISAIYSCYKIIAEN
jgi:hypothetical protein